MALTLVEVSSRVRGQRTAAAARKAANVWWRGASVTTAATDAPAWARVSRAEKLTCSAPTTTALWPTGWRWRWTSCCRAPVVSTPSGRVPGTRRAERGRSRQPVASSTARAVTVPSPSGPVSAIASGPGALAQVGAGAPAAGEAALPVTVVAVRSSTPAAAARATHAAA